ncbi:hypothetical protein QQ045_029823 [Rhodiola kirilowii]
MMKRGREADVSSIEDTFEVAKCLVQISNTWMIPQKRQSCNELAERMFKCKTCDRAFTSFQALGGHRASHHKKPRLMGEDKISEAEKVKAKTIHQCSICGMKFELGQALGGHMRRHRIELKGDVVVVDDHVSREDSDEDHGAKLVPILMRSLSKNKRIMCMDLNLTPLENDLEILFGKKAPKVDCKFF